MANLGFWGKLERPFLMMAPLANVTDAVFRSIIAERARPDVFYTEFVSADGLAHEKARPKLLVDLQYSDIEHPIVAQIFGSKPDNIEYAARLCKELGFDGVDINMGCPDKSIEKQKAGAMMMRNPKLAQEVIAAAKHGCDPLPISVKTRLGYYKTGEFDDWFNALLECDLAAIIVHLRTREEMSKVPAHWELAGRLAELRGSRATLIAGNGDVANIQEAHEKAKQYNLDGIMLGRAIFGNPWLFSGKTANQITHAEWKTTILEHVRRFQKTFPFKNPDTMRKFYRAYADDVEKILADR